MWGDSIKTVKGKVEIIEEMADRVVFSTKIADVPFQGTAVFENDKLIMIHYFQPSKAFTTMGITDLIKALNNIYGKLSGNRQGQFFNELAEMFYWETQSGNLEMTVLYSAESAHGLKLVYTKRENKSPDNL